MHSIEHVERKIGILSWIVKHLGGKTILQRGRYVNPSLGTTGRLAGLRGVESVYQYLLKSLQRIRSNERAGVNVPQVFLFKNIRSQLRTINPKYLAPDC